MKSNSKERSIHCCVVLLLLLVCIFQGCEDSEGNRSTHDDQGGLVSFAESLPPEMHELMGGPLRDTLARNSYPIAYVVSVEILLTSKGLNSSDPTSVRLRSIVPKDALEEYAPALLLGDRIAEPQSTESTVEHGPLVEVEQTYSVPTELLATKDRMLIRNAANSNVLLPEIGIKRVRDAAESSKNAGSKMLLYIPIEL